MPRQKRSVSLLLLAGVFLICLAALVMGGCGGDKDCAEKCSTNLDCRGSMVCIDFVQGQVCGPNECDDCAEICHFFTETEDGKCVFSHCD